MANVERFVCFLSVRFSRFLPSLFQIQWELLRIDKMKSSFGRFCELVLLNVVFVDNFICGNVDLGRIFLIFYFDHCHTIQDRNHFAWL